MSITFSGSRDFGFTLNGVDYYSDFDGETYYSDDGFSIDAISKQEFEMAKEKYQKLELTERCPASVNAGN